MTSIWQSDGAVIGRVRIKTKPADPPAAKQSIARLLGGAAIRQSRLPPSSILCVRKMRDPMPGTRWLDGRRVHLGTEWEQAATRELDRLASGAAYPARASVPPSATAVAFLDRAELLACLTQDWLAGTLPANWWWFVLLQSVGPDTLVMREWDSAPEFLPAAIELLQEQSHAIEFVRRLPEPVAARLLTRMLHAHGIVSAPIAGPLAPSGEAPGPIEEIDAPAPALPPTSPGADPWLPWVPEASVSGLKPAARLLLACALLLRRAPEVARAEWFASQVWSWRGRASVADHARLIPSRDLPDPSQHKIAAPPDAAGATASSAERDVPSAVVESNPASPHRTAVEPAGPRASNPQSGIEPNRAAGDAETPLWDGQLSESSKSEAAEIPSPQSAELAAIGEHGVAPSIIPENAVVPEERASTAAAATAAAVPAAIETAFGGALFLLNVGIYLGLYGDFANPLHPGLELNIWDFVALLGCEFAGEEFCADPVWPTLADLAGRNVVHPPGASFHAPDAWRLPVEWLDQFPEAGTFRAATARDRLIVTHPAAFTVVDVPLAGRTPPQALAEEIKPYSAGVAAIEEDRAMPERSSLARWTSWIAGYLRARLARALGRDDGAALLCRVPARLRITPAHVHVLMRLEGYPVEIRVAGLDRDPGWIPAAGRHVSFHFD